MYFDQRTHACTCVCLLACLVACICNYWTLCALASFKSLKRLMVNAGPLDLGQHWLTSVINWSKYQHKHQLFEALISFLASRIPNNKSKTENWILTNFLISAWKSRSSATRWSTFFEIGPQGPPESIFEVFGIAALPFLCRDPFFSSKYHSVKMWAWLFFCQFSIFVWVKKQICICINGLGCRHYCLLFSKMIRHKLIQYLGKEWGGKSESTSNIGKYKHC